MLLLPENEMSRILETSWLANNIVTVVKAATNLIPRLVLASILVIVAGPPANAAVPCENLTMAGALVKKLTIEAANNRTIPLEILHPASSGKYPLVIFSHGAFASPDRYHELLKPIAAAGYIVLAPRHLDSEDWEWADQPSQDAVWTSRGEDLILMLSQNSQIGDELAESGIEIDYRNIAAMGHSYGGLLAQIVGGARSSQPSELFGYRSVQAVVAFSPPGQTPDLIDKNGWSGMFVPSLTITGTADILPGFVDDWQVHKHSYDFAPAGKRWLWVGEGVDHYFGGMIGREKPSSELSQALFGRALATTIAFLDQVLKRTPSCVLGAPISGEILIKDGGADE